MLQHQKKDKDACFVDVTYRGELLVPALLRVLHCAHIELSNTVDGPTIVNYSWGLPLSFGQNNVHKVLACRDHLDSLEVVQRHASERRPEQGPAPFR